MRFLYLMNWIMLSRSYRTWTASSVFRMLMDTFIDRGRIFSACAVDASKKCFLLSAFFHPEPKWHIKVGNTAHIQQHSTNDELAQIE